MTGDQAVQEVFFLVLSGLPDSEDEGTMIFQNIRNYTVGDTASLVRRIESPWAFCMCTVHSMYHTDHYCPCHTVL